MLAAAVRASEVVGKRLLVVLSLGLIGLVVGVSCALFPITFPFGIIAIAGLVLLWTMPELASIPIDLTRILVLPFIFSIISIPAYYAIVFHDAPWISIRRVILFSLIASTLVTLAGSSAYRSTLKARFKDSKWLAFFVIGYYAIELISAIMSAKPVSAVSDLVNTAINWYIPMIAMIIAFDKLDDVSKAVRTMIAGLLFNVALALIETYIRSNYLYLALPTWVITEIAAQNPIAPVGPVAPYAGNYRASSTFMVSLSWAEFAMMMTPFTLHFMIFGKQLSDRMFGLVGFLAVVIALYSSGSRGGYVGFLADSLLFIAICLFRYVRKNRHSLLSTISTAFFSIGSAGMIASVLFVPAVRIKVLGGGARAASDQGRHEQWALAIPKFFSRPVFGYGPGTANEVVGWTSQGGLPSLDSYVINVMISTGIFGLAFFFPMLLLPAISCFFMKDSISNYNFSLRASLACSLFGYAVYRISLNQTENNALAFVIIGLFFALNSAIKSDGHSAPRSRSKAIQI